MALSNYTELKASIADFLNRDDLTAVIPDFITLAEAAINRDVRHYEMENRATADLDQQYLDRPADWLETIRINITGGGTRHLEYLSAASMADKRAGTDNTTGEPKFFRHAERAFEVFPTPDGTYEVELLYYEKVPALSSTNATNWLLTDHPDVYLYGALLHSSPYLAEDQRIGVWAQLYSAARDRINQSGEDGSFSGSGLTMKIKGLG
jgi:hypothetical protein